MVEEDLEMKEYIRPEALVLDEVNEGVFAASGQIDENQGEVSDQEQNTVVCRFGRKEANPGSDTCQACSFSGGLRDQELSGESLFKSDFSGCPDGLPVKE